MLLVATGRSSGAAALGLDLELDRGYVKIDRRCRTSLPHVYAAGDITGGYQFTHVAAHEGRIAGANAAGTRARLDERVVPWVTFTDPEIAHASSSARAGSSSSSPPLAPCSAAAAAGCSSARRSSARPPAS